MKKVAIVGCGELGSRFLQGTALVSIVTEINIIEPDNNAKAIAKQRLDDVIVNSNCQVKVNWHEKPDKNNMDVDVCIIATQANGRDSLIKQVINLGVKRILTEKIVTQSLESYQDCLDYANKHNVEIWVNCKTRAYNTWKSIKKKIKDNEPISYHSVGGNHGLCTNGLHALDLFVFLTDSLDLLNPVDAIDRVLHTTKRGKFDLSGILQIEGNNSSKCVLHYSSFNNAMPIDVVSTSSFRWIVDNSTKELYEGTASDGWILKTIPFDENISVSAMSTKFIQEILLTGTCELPTLRQAFVSHKLLFEVSLPIFNGLLNKQDNICPIT
jgi:predicted dehydrogenase